MGIFPRISHLGNDRQTLKHWRFGVIHAADGQFVCVQRRWFRHSISQAGIWLVGRRQHLRPGDWIKLYYNQPLRIPDFLAVSYLVSGRDTRLATVTAALNVLDQIGELKGAESMFCHVHNSRLTDRMMTRFGWEEHCPHLAGRHFIKRLKIAAPIWGTETDSLDQQSGDAQT